MSLCKRLLIWVGCRVGVHYTGVRGLGMYGDAARCNHCKADAYGLWVLKEAPREHQ